MERNGFEYIASLLQDYDPKRAREMQGLWLEYEDGQTAEAKWVREMDKFDCLIQAHKYEQSTYGEKDFAEFQGLLAKIHSSEARKWAEILQQEREAHFMRCQQQLPIIFVTGDSNASKKASAYVSTILNLPYISMNTTLHEKAKDKEYRYSKVIHTCIQEHFDIPVSLLVDLLEKEIGNIGKQKQWVLVSGFPKDTDELVEFERKVQKSNHVIFLQCTDDPEQISFKADNGRSTWKLSTEDFGKNLDTYVKLTGSQEELCQLSMESVNTIIKKAEIQ